jgi:hypothetical protein
MCLAGLIVAAAAVLAWWLLPVFRATPELYPALRCLKARRNPGERRFWVRLQFWPVFVVESVDAYGVVQKVSVFDPKCDRKTFEELASPTKGVPGWKKDGDRFHIDLKPYYRGYPRLQRVPLRLWAEFNRDYGARYVAERDAPSHLQSMPSE